MSVSFGIHVESPTVVAAYLNGGFVNRYSVPTAATGTYIALAAAFNTTPGQPHVDRLEVRTAPGGTLLLADDFNSRAAWTDGWLPNGIPWTISPAGFAYSAAHGATIYQAQPSGAAYIEAQGVTFDASTDSGWVQLMLNRTYPNNAPDNSADDGYRIILYAPGTVDAGTTHVFNGVLLGGWGVGQIRIA
jgi:hypothetical protein